VQELRCLDGDVGELEPTQALGDIAERVRGGLVEVARSLANSRCLLVRLLQNGYVVMHSM
jgi:hypothetical protein